MTQWRGYMTRPTLCRYLQIGTLALERQMASGRLPGPFALGNRDHWSKDAVDKALATTQELI